jgi:hypothetical protein
MQLRPLANPAIPVISTTYVWYEWHIRRVWPREKGGKFRILVLSVVTGGICRLVELGYDYIQSQHRYRGLDQQLRRKCNGISHEG